MRTAQKFARKAQLGHSTPTTAAFVTGIWSLDIAGIHTQAAHGDDGFLIFFILWFFHGLLFDAVQIRYQVWQIGREGQ